MEKLAASERQFESEMALMRGVLDRFLASNSERFGDRNISLFVTIEILSAQLHAILGPETPDKLAEDAKTSADVSIQGTGSPDAPQSPAGSVCPYCEDAALAGPHWCAPAGAYKMRRSGKPPAGRTQFESP